MKTIEDQLNGKMKNLYTASRNAGERPKKKVITIKKVKLAGLPKSRVRY